MGDCPWSWVLVPEDDCPWRWVLVPEDARLSLKLSDCPWRWVLVPEDKDTVILQNVGNYSPFDTTSHPGRYEASVRRLWEPQASHKGCEDGSRMNVLCLLSEGLLNLRLLLGTSITFNDVLMEGTKFCNIPHVSLNLLRPSGHVMDQQVLISKDYIHSAHTVHLLVCVLYGSQNKQRLFHCTALTDWFV
jgi:hypothetical protein